MVLRVADIRILSVGKLSHRWLGQADWKSEKSIVQPDGGEILHAKWTDMMSRTFLSTEHGLSICCLYSLYTQFVVVAWWGLAHRCYLTSITDFQKAWLGYKKVWIWACTLHKTSGNLGTTANYVWYNARLKPEALIECLTDTMYYRARRRDLPQ